MSGIGFRGVAGRFDEGAVQGHKRPPSRSTRREDLGQLRCLRGDHVDRFVQVPVGGGLADVGVPSQQVYIGAIDQPTQHQRRLAPAGPSPLPRPGIDPGAVRLDPAGHAGNCAERDVKGGTI